MSSHVFLEVAGLGERSEADDAREPAFPGVYQHVTSHGRVESERLGADRALVGSFASVASLVITHLVQPREMSSAVFTRERSFTYSTRHMDHLDDQISQVMGNVVM